jgi:hypothetical protein
MANYLKKSTSPSVTVLFAGQTTSGTYWVTASPPGNECQSDRTNFTVTVNIALPSCVSSVAQNSLKLTSSTTYYGSTGNSYESFDYFNTNYNLSSGTGLSIVFGKKPTGNGIQVFKAVDKSFYLENLADDECTISLSTTTSYVSTAGEVYVEKTGNVFHVVYCNVNMRRSNGTNYSNTKANLYYD